MVPADATSRIAPIPENGDSRNQRLTMDVGNPSVASSDIVESVRAGDEGSRFGCRRRRNRGRFRRDIGNGQRTSRDSQELQKPRENRPLTEHKKHYRTLDSGCFWTPNDPCSPLVTQGVRRPICVIVDRRLSSQLIRRIGAPQETEDRLEVDSAEGGIHAPPIGSSLAANKNENQNENQNENENDRLDARRRLVMVRRVSFGCLPRRRPCGGISRSDW